MKITSSAFENNEKIPAKYTCEGENINPPLSFTELPRDTKSLVLIMDDPDVSLKVQADGNWDHWIVFNIPGDTTGVEENEVPKDSVLGENTAGRLAYGGPCPPTKFEPKQHRYFFKLYALDNSLDIEEGARKAEVEIAMKDKIIDSAMLIGVYECQEERL